MIKLVSRIKVITHLRARLAGLGRAAEPLPAPLTATPRAIDGHMARRLVAIGASTGGPGALVEILRGLPATFPVPVLIVLHINEPFGAAFAEWLDAKTAHRVSYARDGAPIAEGAGRILMAPPGKHLVVAGSRLRLTSDPERHSCRPSIDVLFDSIAREMGAATIAALLTGMGRDGATGLLGIRRAGGATIAQDEATSTVYGMSREAALIGAADQILPIQEIGHAIAIAAGAAGQARR
jgi:two-component system chemotaxis response regulator CheB